MDQALLVAVHRGGKTLWSRLTAPDFVYVEEGGLTRRSDFLRDLTPDDGAILLIQDYELHRSGDTIVVLHHDLVPPDPADPRSSQPQMYVMTETWSRDQGRWKLHVVHVDAVKTAPPTLALTASQMDELAGTYHRGDAVFRIERVGDHLVGRRSGRGEIALKAETRDVLFDPEQLRGRYVFQRDAQGHVTGFARRFENSDSIWTRAD